MTAEATALDGTIATTERALVSLAESLHGTEKETVGFGLQLRRADEELARIQRTLEQIATERRRAEEERSALDTRESGARDSVAQLDLERRNLDERFALVQRTLQDAREAATERGRRASEATARFAALGERALALANDVRRLEEARRELEARIVSRRDEWERNRRRRAELDSAIIEGHRLLEEDTQAYAELAAQVRGAEDKVAALQQEYGTEEERTRAVRQALDEMRASVAQLDVARATAASDLAHLATSCQDTLQMDLEAVAAEVDQLESEGRGTPDPSAIYADDEDDFEEEGGLGAEAPARSSERAGEERTAAQRAVDDAERAAAGLAARAMTAEEAIAALRAKIERLGPVNMMAVEQFDELEARHQFLSTQRKDLVDSIAQTGEAIKRIEKTTRERFREAFTAINRYFEETFTTLFGGGRAGLVLLDEEDLLESGIDIIAQPPGKRLQNMTLLSGGEKALTAMALMFAIFQYRPSPFCLLDEIDAPLDDANIGRFLEMLRSMQGHTQFIVITHSRKTMEMADRLYGVTMEEPGVSKLISLELN
jgi:chromosome segregation protein